MHRKGMAEPRLGNVAVEHREVGRMEDAVAEAGEGGHQDQHRVAGGEMQHDAGQRETGDAAAEYARRPEAVDKKAGRRLADTGNDEKNGHRGADAGETQAEFRHQPWKQRRQQQVEKVRNAMHKTDHRDGFDIAGGGRGEDFGGHRAARGLSGSSVYWVVSENGIQSTLK